MVTDVFRWVGIRPVNLNTPVPAVPVPHVVELLWVGLRRVEYTFANDYPTAKPVAGAQNPAGGTITGTGVLDVKVTGSLGAKDPDGDALTYTVVTEPRNGSVEMNQDGTYTYSADPAFAHRGGQDSFTVRIDDSAGNPWHLHGLAELLGLRGPTTVTVPVTVAAVNRAPTATTAITDLDPDGDGKATGNVSAADADADPLTYRITGGPSHGTASVDSAGTYSYAASDEARHAIYTTPGAPTTDTFTITTSDGLGGETTTTVTVALTKLNRDPTVSLDISEPLGSTGVVTIVPSPSDPDDDDVTVTVALVSADASKGFLRRNDDGSYTFLPTQAAMNNAFVAGFNGSPTDPDLKATVTVTATDVYGGTFTEDYDVAIARYFLSTIDTDLTTVGGFTVNPNGEPLVWDPTTGGYIADPEPPPLVVGGLYTLGFDSTKTRLVVNGPDGTISFEAIPGTDYEVRQAPDGRQALYAGSALIVFFDLSE